MLCPSCAAENQQGVEVCFACGRHLTALTQGSVIASRYEILSLLGKGGMGMVYKAADRLLEEVVAIKVLRNEFIGTPEMAQRFRSEIKLARKVSHPNVCRIHEYGEDAGVSYISMALIEGTDLRKLLLQHPEGMPRDEAYQVAIQVAEGLQAIHDVGIIHRDLKTPNIVIEPSGLVRLMDFGIAKESGRTGGLTASGEVMGTPEYMSPEQCRGDKLDFRSDVYSLGIVIYEIFTGHVPFRGETLMATLLKQLQDPPPLDGPLAARIPQGVVRLLRKAMAKDSAHRFGSSAEVALALREARKEPEPVEAPPTRALRPLQERRKHSRLDISVDVVLKRTSAGGAVLQEERTVADNIGRRGARVMTAMTGLAPGDTMVLQEVGSDFQARAVVRYIYKPVDNIQRLGIEFMDRAAPDHLVPTDADSGSRLLRSVIAPAAERPATAPAARPTASAPVASPTPAPEADRRRDSRLDISVDVILKRVGLAGQVLQEERTVADNVGRHGARVLTSMTGLQMGDIVSFEEVGSSFRTRAAVRSSYAGKDNIHRLGVEFLDRMAPDHLVANDDSKPRIPLVRVGRPPDPRTPPPKGEPDLERLRERRREIIEAYEGVKTRNHFEILGIPRASSAAQVKEAYIRLTKQFHPDVRMEAGLLDLQREAEAVFLRVAEAHDVLIDPERRSAYENRLGPSWQTPKPVPVVAAPAPAPAADPPPEPPPPAPTENTNDPESDSRLADQILWDAKRLLKEEKYWEAIKALEGALELARGTKINHAIRVLLARATAKNPKWQRRAETILLAVVEENPANVEAHFVLGTIYRAAGIKTRALVEFRRVLELHPGHLQALSELQALKTTRGQPTRS